MMTRSPRRALLLSAALLAAVIPACAQLIKATPAPAEPTTPAPRHFTDPHYGVSFHLPAGWNFTRRDGELSTFSLDARSAPRTAQLRAVADLSFNPYPRSTFSGAFLYFSVSPRATDADCATQAVLPLHRPASTAEINGVSFAHGHDEHGGICIEARDEVYTTYRRHACYRFDLVTNNFCGGDAGGGARDMTKPELDNIRGRLETILNTLQLKP